MYHPLAWAISYIAWAHQWGISVIAITSLMCILQASVYTYVAKLSIIISIGSIASIYNQNIDKKLAQLIHEKFFLQFFTRKPFLGNFHNTKTWCYTIFAIQKFGTIR